MRKNDVRAFWAFPSEHKYLMIRTSLDALYDMMVERNIPLFISAKQSCGGLTSWHLFETVLSETPDLTLVVTEHGSWGEDRFPSFLFFSWFCDGFFKRKAFIQRHQRY